MQYLDEALESYAKTDMYPFHMPGHKRGKLPFPNLYDIDITEIDGFDNLHHAEGILKEAQERAARLYGSLACYYLVNGSTCGILAAVCAAAKRGSKVLAARNSHKAVYHALFLGGLRARYLYPRITASGIQGQITAQQVEAAFAEDPEIAAVVITSPTYEGIVSDIAQIAETAHRHGAPLIVDEAHGAHFGFGFGFPENAVRLGADAVIMSLHKTLPSPTQTALLHICSERISKEQIERYLGIFQTSSPSYVLMAGMDACIRFVERAGGSRFLAYRKLLDDFYQSCRALRSLHVMAREDLAKEEAFDWDDSKLVIFSGKNRMSGKKLHEILRSRYHLELEMASGDYALGMTSLMDTREGFQRLADALHEIDAQSPKAFASENECINLPLIKEKSGFIEQIYQENPMKMQIYEALQLPWREVSLEEAVGEVSADYVYLYPPGIPILAPGEVITGELPGRLKECARLGLSVEGGSGLASGRIKIV